MAKPFKKDLKDARKLAEEIEKLRNELSGMADEDPGMPDAQNELDECIYTESSERITLPTGQVIYPNKIDSLESIQDDPSAIKAYNFMRGGKKSRSKLAWGLAITGWLPEALGLGGFILYLTNGYFRKNVDEKARPAIELVYKKVAGKTPEEQLNKCSEEKKECMENRVPVKPWPAAGNTPVCIGESDSCSSYVPETQYGDCIQDITKLTTQLEECEKARNKCQDEFAQYRRTHKYASCSSCCPPAQRVPRYTK